MDSKIKLGWAGDPTSTSGTELRTGGERGRCALQEESVNGKMTDWWKWRSRSSISGGSNPQVMP